MIAVEAARERILAGLGAVGRESVGLDRASGRVLARDVLARLTQPPAPLSAMDGFAVRAGDVGPEAALTLRGESAAGHPWPHRLGPGEAVRISTGAVVPDGADAILMAEDATEADGRVQSGQRRLVAGRHVRLPGQDFAAGERLVAAGRRLRPRDIGLIAAGNHAFVTVYRRPRIAVLMTGDELSLPGAELRPGGVVASNGHALAALIAACGGEPHLLEVAPDRVEAIRAAIDDAAGSDMLVTVGGASVGPHDLVQAALRPAGFSCDFWKVAMRPGKPLISGRLGPMPLLGLPGNPVSALITAALFLAPAIARLAGDAAGAPEPEPAVLGRALPAQDQRAEFLRATLSRDATGALCAMPAPDQASSLLRVLAESDALILRPAHAPAAAAGAGVGVLRLAALGL